MANLKENDPGNIFATLFGFAKDGTSWLVDFAVTMILTAFVIGFIDWMIDDAVQFNHPVISNTVIVVPSAIFAVYVWRRASADNRRRKEERDA